MPIHAVRERARAGRGACPFPTMPQIIVSRFAPARTLPASPHTGAPPAPISPPHLSSSHHCVPAAHPSILLTWQRACLPSTRSTFILGASGSYELRTQYSYYSVFLLTYMPRACVFGSYYLRPRLDFYRLC